MKKGRYIPIEKLAYILGESLEWVKFQIENGTFYFVDKIGDFYYTDSRNLEHYLCYGSIDLDFRYREEL